MRDIDNDPFLSRHRVANRADLGKLDPSLAGVEGIWLGNAFEFRHKGEVMFVLATPAHMGWDHVSASFARRCPTWAEMEWLKRKFFLPDEVVVQLHVEETRHVNFHPYVLHLWRPVDGKIPMPPIGLV